MVPAKFVYARGLGWGGGILGEFKGESQLTGKGGPCLKAFTGEEGNFVTVMR